MHTEKGGFRSVPVRILAVTVAACGLLLAPRPALAIQGRAGSELAQPVRQKHPSHPRARPSDETPSPAAVPKARAPKEDALPENRSSEPADKPDEDEEVSPGDSPASCDGCELAGFMLAGSLWGLFGVSRQRGVPRAVIRGLQPR